MTQSQLLQFVNCSILRNHEIIWEDIWVRGGKIVNPEKMFFDEKISADVQIDCRGALISPGFIELQINGGFGVDFSCDFEDVEEGLRVVAKGILAHGVTSFCPTVVTSPAHVYDKVLPRLKKQAGGPKGATVLGVHVEGPFINPLKKGAHPEQFIKTFEKGFDSVLETYGCLDNVRIVTVAPELEKAPEVIEKFVERGITVSLGHSMASLGEGEAAVKHGASFITHLFNAMLPFHHRDPGLVGLLASDAVPDDHVVYFGIISDGIHTHPAALRIAHRTHPKGLVLVTDAISALGLEEGMHQLGQLSVEVKAGCAYIAGTDTLCGSIATMSECVKFFKEATSCSIVEALEAATLHPAKALGIDQTKGSLHFGADADFIFLGKDMDLWSTWISGECVYQAEGKTEAACFCKVKRK
ncbi:N-acetylglucosamine-6-phosphate deacetylase isoform X1 [Schistocerca americana]|uniref:N-acetylglucosamine-6-phosphate deacetylase isoform X1 n=1 Tax=Schistocerca americana TaxID=7009 RepID=UPI001F4FFA17|nr:N-acetylglucosamine-6-phosphate deacetylase isoform X1 [Schistocerca americana]